MRETEAWVGEPFAWGALQCDCHLFVRSGFFGLRLLSIISTCSSFHLSVFILFSKHTYSFLLAPSLFVESNKSHPGDCHPPEPRPRTSSLFSVTGGSRKYHKPTLSPSCVHCHDAHSRSDKEMEVAENRSSGSSRWPWVAVWW